MHAALLVLLAAAAAAAAFPTAIPVPAVPPPVPTRLCGTGPPGDALVQAHAQHRQAGRLQPRAPPATAPIVVDTYLHVVSTTDQAGLVGAAAVAGQLGVLQAAYAAANISFRLAGVDYSINDAWATDAADADMKAALRRGNYSALNVYFQSNLSAAAAAGGGQMLGYCTLPTNVTYAPCAGCAPVEFPARAYALDGCNVLAGSMPGGPARGYDLGRTAVHEVGHWFGLLHTFQDDSCAAADPGDFIDDTPQEGVSTDGCPVGKHSCPAVSGLDPIHNYMDYSTDVCYESFTPDQIARMQHLYQTMRFGN